MKNLLFISFILIILFKTGNVLSDNNIFNVNNVDINKDNSKENKNLTNLAFKEAFDRLTYRLLLEEDYRKVYKTDLNEIKKLISYYQVINPGNKENNKNKSFNVFFDKDRMHNFFYNRNLLYADISDTEVVIFPLLKEDKKYFIYSKNYFYENWNKKTSSSLIKYFLPVENIENIQKINLKEKDIYNLNITDFFQEYSNNNIVFANIEINKNKANIFLNTKIEGKKIKKTISFLNKDEVSKSDFFDNIISLTNKVIKDLIKSQNLIDVRTPSFLNVKIKLNDQKNFVKFNNRIEKIDLIDNFYVQKLHKDYILVKIKYLGKINKIIEKLKEQNINLKMIAGDWELSII